MPEIKKTIVFFESVTELLCEVLNTMNDDLKIATFDRRADKLRIAVPEPLLSILKNEYKQMLKNAVEFDNEGYFRFRGIRLIENYQFNVAVFHVDWYSWNTVKQHVQTFDIRRK